MKRFIVRVGLKTAVQVVFSRGMAALMYFMISLVLFSADYYDEESFMLATGNICIAGGLLAIAVADATRPRHKDDQTPSER